MSTDGISRVILADHELPRGPGGGARRGAPHHAGVGRRRRASRDNGPVFGVIERGSVRFQVDGGPTITLRAGDTFHEPAGTLIDRFDATDEGAEFLAWFPLPVRGSSGLVPRS